MRQGDDGLEAFLLAAGLTLKLGLTALALLWATGAPAHAQEIKAEVIHWWTSGGESAAVKVFADQFTKAGGTWVDTAIATFFLIFDFFWETNIRSVCL